MSAASLADVSTPSRPPAANGTPGPPEYTRGTPNGVGSWEGNLGERVSTGGGRCVAGSEDNDGGSPAKGLGATGNTAGDVSAGPPGDTGAAPARTPR
mmetsp:Transcript_6199/g.24851  ORF Transcript_6199/g.24851 Transcript_6199/m.24851 type:complete len:97 (+) Transcript_6199:1653-1943(+)